MFGTPGEEPLLLAVPRGYLLGTPGELGVVLLIGFLGT